MEDTPEQEGVELKLQSMLQNDNVGFSLRHYLGMVATQFLNSPAKLAAFSVDEDGLVCLLDPMYIYVGHGAMDKDKNKKVRWVKPVVGEGPLHCAMRDGKLWVVEYEEPEDTQ
jgi:hypothetical protein